jgi:general secretion pathway protein A
MDLAPFGLTRRPFRTTPDTELYFPAAAHEAALLSVRRAYSDASGVAILDGEPGTGKTLLGLKFLDSLDAEQPRAILHCPRGIKPTELLQAILFDLGQPYQNKSEHELRLAVHEELLNALGDGQPLVLLIDEGHNLTPEVLEEIRLLGNLQSRDAKALFTLILGLPGLRETLAKPDCVAFSQRVAVRSRVAPLSDDEAAEYLRVQLKDCGGRAEWLLGEEATALILKHSNGIPRVLNRVASLAFTLAGAAGEKVVDAEAVYEALVQLELMTTEPEEDPSGPKPKLIRGGEPEMERSNILQHPGPTPRVKSAPVKTGRKPQAKRKLA